MLNFVHFIKHLKQTGAVAPSSRFLASQMVTSLRHRNIDDARPLRILELGPGTGVITREIVRLMRPDDQLDIVELNAAFYEHIRDKYQSEKIRVYGMNVVEFQPDYQYDYIFSSIPYEQIPPDVTQTIWQKKLALALPSARITYYKYYRFNYFRSAFEQRVNENLCQESTLIWRNMPPAVVYQLTAPEATEKPANPVS
jgi:phosphatidylethanolamine/phosphatidyl-N-methylethanolamine N-methyltransferase